MDGLLGLEITALDDCEARGAFAVENAVRQRWGLVHGGAYAALAELLASEGTNCGVWANGDIGVGLANHTSFLRPVSSGRVTAIARRRHRGRTTWLWDVEMFDQLQRQCAISRVTIAIRPREPRPK
jgi:1,4-dihydroxy-2-naphthoyl-CoA hydrolase